MLAVLYEVDLNRQRIRAVASTHAHAEQAMPVMCRACGIHLKYRGATSGGLLAAGAGTGEVFGTKMGMGGGGALTGIGDTASAQGQAVEGECNANTQEICDLHLGSKYAYHCCCCLKRMGVLNDQLWNSALCCNSCKARWPSLPDTSPLPPPGGGGCCQIC